MRGCNIDLGKHLVEWLVIGGLVLSAMVMDNRVLVSVSCDNMHVANRKNCFSSACFCGVVASFFGVLLCSFLAMCCSVAQGQVPLLGNVACFS